MLIQRGLTNRILVNAQRLRKESLELRHTCRNTRSISRLLRDLLQEESRTHQVRLAHSSIQISRRRARHNFGRFNRLRLHQGLNGPTPLSCAASSELAPNAHTGPDGV